MLFFLLAADEVAPAPVITTFRSSSAGEIAILVLMIVLALAVSPPKYRPLALQPVIFLALGLLMYALDWIFVGFGMHSLFGFLASLFIFACVGRAGFLLIIGILRRLVNWAPQKIYLDVTMGAIYLVVFFQALSNAGLKASDLVTSTAVVTGILALAMQGTLGNIFAGIAIHIHNPFSIGDWIQFDDKREHIGKVKEMSWRATTVVTLDAVEVVVPNSKLAEMPLTNFMRPDLWSRRSVYFVCPYSVPPARVRSIVLQAIEGAKGLKVVPNPTIVTNAFTERGIEYWLRYFIEDLDIRDGIDGGVRDRVWYGLHREGIIMPPAVHNVEMLQVTHESKDALDDREQKRREGILRSLSLWQGLPDQALATLAGQSVINRYLPHEQVIKQHDPGNDLFVVQSGKVKVSVAKPGEAPVELTQLGPGDFFGEMSLFLGAPRSATVTADSECELLVIGKNALAAVLKESPDVAETISRTVESRQTQLASRLAEPSQDKPTETTSTLVSQIKKYFGVS